MIADDPLGPIYLEPTPRMVGAPDEPSGAPDGTVLDPILAQTYRDHPFDSGSYFVDPWGNPYGYYYDPDNDEWRAFMSPSSPDVWSTGGETADNPSSRAKWLSSWDDGA